MNEQQYPDIERAANTILSQQQTAHPILRAWVAAVAANPQETRDLRTFVAGPLPGDVTWETAHNRMPAGPDLAQRILEREAHPYRTNQFSVYFNREIDLATYLLTSAVVDFRAAGRPEGDVERGRVIRVTTSLAARVAEFVEHQRRAWGNEVWVLQNGEPLGEELPEA